MEPKAPPKEPEKKPEKIGGFSQRTLETLAAASSVAMGAVLAWREILSESYANFTQLDLVDDIKRKFRKDFGPSHSSRLEGGMSRDNSVEAVVKQNNEYNRAVAERMKKAGFESNTVSGFMNRAKLLSSHERWKIGMTAGAVSAVAAGSLLMLTKDLFDKKEKSADVEPRPESFAKAEESKAAQASEAGLGK